MTPKCRIIITFLSQVTNLTKLFSSDCYIGAHEEVVIMWERSLLMIIMGRLVLIRFPMIYNGRSHQARQPPSVSVWRVCPGAEGNLQYYECYFYTPNIMEYLMARELFMEIGREIMSMEDCIKCYDNGDNTQHSAPHSGGNIWVC